MQRRVSASLAAVERGAKLSSQLLAFARRQPLSPAVCNPQQIFEGVGELLQRALGETIQIDVQLPQKPWHINVDRNQLENALLNLAINARDAMHGEGTITISGKNLTLDRQFCLGKGISPGDYVQLSVHDTGDGMDSETLKQAFEPFFTTKADGHGTGLGLSMVFGFVKQSGGHIDMTSTPGEGTCDWDEVYATLAAVAGLRPGIVFLAVGKGKKMHDKRQDIKEREAKREISRAMSRRK